MNIGMLVDTYKPHISGVTNHVALTKRTLESQGHRVFVFTLGGEDYVDEELYVVRSPSIPLAETGFSFSYRYTRAAQRKLALMDVVHVHHPFISGRLALRYCQNLGLPIVFTNHTRYDLYARVYLPQVPELFSEAFLQTYLPRFCQHCDLTIAPSRGIAAVLRGFGVRDQIEIIPNGVDLSRFRSEPQNPLTRADIGLFDDDLVLMYVGRVGPEKSLTTLLQAFAGAQAAIDRLRLVIVGDGPELPGLQDWAARAGVGAKVIFAGAAEYEDVPAYLRLADAFATASKTEVHPLSLIEAMASGLPAIGVRSPGIEDTIENGVNGILCRDDLAEFTAQMVRLMLEDDRRKEMAGRARTDADRFDITRTSQLLLEQYQQLQHERPRHSPGLVQRLKRFIL